jgi:hypothetical protein
MPGSANQLVGVVCLSGVAGVVAVMLAAAAGQAFQESAGLVGAALASVAAAAGVASVGSGAWGVCEWYRGEVPPQTKSALPAGADHLLHTLRAVYSQRAFVVMAAKMAFMAGLINLLVEVYQLSDCQIIPLMGPSAVFSDPDDQVDQKGPHGTSEYTECHNFGLLKHLIGAQQHTMYTETAATAWLLGFFTSLFGFGETRQAILGEAWNTRCTGRRGPPRVQAMSDDLLGAWYLRMWPTGRRSPVVRRRIWVRASLMGLQLGVVWTVGVMAGLWLIHNTTSWDGGMRKAWFIAFKTCWCAAEALMSVAVGFAAATSENALNQLVELERAAPGRSQEDPLGTPLRDASQLDVSVDVAAMQSGKISI